MSHCLRGIWCWMSHRHRRNECNNAGCLPALSHSVWSLCFNVTVNECSTILSMAAQARFWNHCGFLLLVPLKTTSIYCTSAWLPFQVPEFRKPVHTATTLTLIIVSWDYCDYWVIFEAWDVCGRGWVICQHQLFTTEPWLLPVKLWSSYSCPTSGLTVPSPSTTVHTALPPFPASRCQQPFGNSNLITCSINQNFSVLENLSVLYTIKLGQRRKT